MTSRPCQGRVKADITWDFGSSHSPLQRPRANSPSGKLVAPGSAMHGTSWHIFAHGTEAAAPFFLVWHVCGSCCGRLVAKTHEGHISDAYVLIKSRISNVHYVYIYCVIIILTLRSIRIYCGRIWNENIHMFFPADIIAICHRRLVHHLMLYYLWTIMDHMSCLSSGTPACCSSRSSRCNSSWTKRKRGQFADHLHITC